jgi:DNA polymerase-3 subunit alpha (Gram-positive type)
VAYLDAREGQQEKTDAQLLAHVSAELLREQNIIDVTCEKIAYSKSKKCYVLFLHTKKLLFEKEQKKITALFENAFTGIPLAFQFEQPIELLEQDQALLEKTIKEFLLAEEPSFAPFLIQSTIKCEENGICMYFARELAPHMAKRMQLDKKINCYLQEKFGCTKKVVSLAVSDADEIQEQDQALLEIIEKEAQVLAEKTAKEKLQQAKAAPSMPTQPAKPTAQKATPSRTNRRKAQRNREIDKMIDLQPETDVFVEGDVFDLETIVTRDGKNTIYIIKVTDYTSSVMCSKFLRGTGAGVGYDVKKGDRVQILGTYVYDTFRRDYKINIKDLVAVEKTQGKPDTAPKKRVELHLHTNMSAQDGMSSASSYIDRAAEWGHTAIAITDHGVVQAFPEASGAARGHEGLKVIYGMEAYLVDVPNKIYNGAPYSLEDEFIVFDIETTGLSKEVNEIIEIGAVRVKNGNILEEFQSFVRPKLEVPYEITKLTGITQEMVKDAPEIERVLEDFWAFAKDTCLVAHNAAFDTGFLFGASRKLGMQVKSDVFDTLLLARVHLKHMRSRSLDRLAAHYKIPLQHHRAVNDAICTAQVFYAMLREITAEHSFTTLADLNYLADTAVLAKTAQRPNHLVVLCKNQTGLVNLYKLVSMSHLHYFHNRPRLPKNELAKHREGLIFGSGCEQGELYQAVLRQESEARIEEIAKFYDYLEIQPHGNNAFMIRNGTVENEEALSEINRRIYALGKKLNIPVVATGDVHFLEERDEYYRRILMETSGFKDADNQAPLYFKTTDEMLADFAYLGAEAAEEVVVTNTNLIAEQIEEIELFPSETVMPTIDNADTEIKEAALEKMHRIYGTPLPEHIETRLFKELDSIIKHGYAVLYWSSMKLVKKSMEDGYLVGSRGSVGSSLAAYAMDISEVNPLPPHYVCPHCKHSDFAVEKERFGCGVDLPEAVCPKCGTPYIADGYDIPFETFLGLNAEKVPDIDLNFSGEYRAEANKYVEELFGAEYVFRAGTISALQENSAKGLVRKYMEMQEVDFPGAEIDRLAQGMSGIKKTTGQHPGGLVIVPRDREIYEFTPIQKPADKASADTITTHFDFNSMHDILVKLDILGHDNPTIMKMLSDMTGLDPLKDVPLNDAATLSLFSSTEALNITPEQIRGIAFGVLGIPEFGTKPTMRILKTTMPTTMAELIRISGLSHGTDVWKGNAEELILSGTTTLNNAICTRDDIMLGLVNKGVDHQMAFFIMESVRKGNWAKGKEKNQAAQEAAMREAGVEEWFIESCRKIQYMFPKAHAAAYVVMAMRIAYFKVHYPKEFYAVAFSIRAEDFNCETILGGVSAIGAELDRLEALGMKQTMTEKSASVVLELALEMLARGYTFLPPDLQKSDAKRFVVEGESLRLPFLAVPMLGEKAAETLATKVKEKTFYSIEELKKECKLSQTVIDTMRTMGCLAGLPEKAQLSIFEAFSG